MMPHVRVLTPSSGSSLSPIHPTNPRGTRLGTRGRMEPSPHVIRTVDAHRERERERKKKRRRKKREEIEYTRRRETVTICTGLTAALGPFSTIADRIVPT